MQGSASDFLTPQLAKVEAQGANRVRVGDTAANDGALAALEHTSLPMPVKSATASATAAIMRVFLMPIDAWKTTKQVEGEEGLKRLRPTLISSFCNGLFFSALLLVHLPSFSGLLRIVPSPEHGTSQRMKSK